MIKAITPNDPHFILNDGLIVANRAGFEISEKCPTDYRKVLADCIQRGWLKPVAHVTAEEYMVMQLSH